ncbi:hypothetical protein BGZ65_003323 [Modicella reniformis]|uniref:USP8 dimerisation domain-containing protein n=1 Tax=Modicella reniformis TaxID=1440133 RepID=A0A9P6M9C1_9FUNG|nr:hypothetical protein BGZ65_003323 [Modicella reniformis]
MDLETVILPPRTRLHELKTSAAFSSEEFNLSIKTWVNTASLLVKQGSMYESTTDDGNAYISYVRACLIITKIIPHQALYSSMMNDIVCIDLRQKILGIIARMGHLERRLLKRFEQENQERMANLEKESFCTSGKTCNPSLQSKQMTERDSGVDKEDEGLDTPSLQRTTLCKDDNEEEGTDETANEVEDFVDLNYDVPVSAIQFSPALDTQAYATHHDHQQHSRRQQHRRTISCVREEGPTQGVSSYNPLQQQPFSSLALTLDKTGSVQTLKKKSSNEDERSLVSPECQPNLMMPSALFARQREGGHVRRCSSTDAIRNSVHFPTSYQAFFTGEEAIAAPVVPPRSQKRASTVPMVRSNSNNSAMSVNSINGHHKSYSEVVTMTMPDYRGAASSLVNDQESNLNSDSDKTRAKYAKEVLKNRFTAKRTTSYENSTFNHNVTSSVSTSFSEAINCTSAQTNVLKKSNSISHRSKADLPPTPRLSVQNLPNTTEESSSLSASLSAHMSPSSASSGSGNQLSSASPTCPSPSVSPQLRMNNPQFVGHGYSFSLTSMPSGSTVTAPVDVSLSSSSSTGSLSCNSTSTSPTTPDSPSSLSPVLNAISPQVEPQSQLQQTPAVPATTTCTSASSSTSGNTTTNNTTTTTSGMKAGLLRKIRSRPKMKDQVFEIVASPSLTTSHPSQPSPAAVPLQHQQKIMV